MEMADDIEVKEKHRDVRWFTVIITLVIIMSVCRELEWLAIFVVLGTHPVYSVNELILVLGNHSTRSLVTVREHL